MRDPDRLHVEQAEAGSGWVFVIALVAQCACLPLSLDGAAAAGWAVAGRSLAGSGAARPLAGVLAGSLSWLPLGEPALRIGLAGALISAAAAALLFAAVRRLAGGGVGAGAAGVVAALLALGTGPHAIEEAVAMAAVALIALALSSANGDEGDAVGGRALAAFVVLGAALGDGVIGFSSLALPLVAWALWSLRRGARWPLLAPFALSLGALVLLAPAVAGARHGVAGPSAAELWQRLWPAGGVASIRVVALPGRAWLVERRLGFTALLAAALGLVTMARGPRKSRALPAVLLVAMAAEVLLAGAPDSIELPDSSVRAAASAAWSIAAGAGVAAIVGALLAARDEGLATPARRYAAVALALSLGAIVLAPAWLAAAPARFSPRRSLARWTRAALEQAPPRALLLVRAGGLGPALRYAAEASGARPDVTLLFRDALDDAGALARSIDRGGDLALPHDEVTGWRARSPRARRDDRGPLLERLIAHSLGTRAILWEAPAADAPESDPAPPLGALSAAVPLERIEPAALPPAPPRALADRIESLAAANPDPLLRSSAADLLSALADPWLASDPRRAAALYQAALSFAPEATSTTLRLGETLARRDQPDKALLITARVLSRHPERLDVQLHQARWRLATGDLDGADSAYRAAAALDPRSASVLCGLARVAHARGDLLTARRHLDHALALDPANPEARALSTDYGVE